MLKKFSKISPRGYQILGAKVRPSQANAGKQLQQSDENVQREDNQVISFSSNIHHGKAEWDEIKSAESLIFKILQSRRSLTNIGDEFCNQKDKSRYRASVGEKVYLWCSGVVAATSMLVWKKWLIPNGSEPWMPIWSDSTATQKALTRYIFGVPRDTVLLSVKATGGAVQGPSKGSSTFDHAAEEFKSKTNECTGSILNKLGIQMMSSNEKNQAAELFRAASESGNLSAIYNMGLCYEHGRGVPQDIKKSIEYYELAASKGHAKSQYNLATFYAKGIGDLEKDASKAFNFLVQAAENGIAKAQVYLGIHFAKENKQSCAAKYFMMASNQNDAVGMYHYAVCLENGWGVHKDEAKAGALYKESAEMGYVSAMFNTGAYYENGLGDFTKSRRKAMIWYEKAADRGDEEARRKFKHLQATPKEAQNYMHPLLRDIFIWNLLQEKPEGKKDFQRSKSAPNLQEASQKLNPRGSFSNLNISADILEESSGSFSCGLQMSDFASKTSSISFGLV